MMGLWENNSGTHGRSVLHYAHTINIKINSFPSHLKTHLSKQLLLLLATYSSISDSLIHSHPLWSSIIPYLLRPSIMIHGILQFTCQTVFFHKLFPSYLWSTSWPGKTKAKTKRKPKTKPTNTTVKTAHICMCITVIHNTVWNSSDNLPNAIALMHSVGGEGYVNRTEYNTIKAGTSFSGFMVFHCKKFKVHPKPCGPIGCCLSTFP